MSSLKVRTAFRDKVRTWLQAKHPDVPYHETVNTQQDPSDSAWVTLEFMPNYSEDISIGCNENAEYGQVDVFIFTKSGKGDQQALTMADTLINSMKGFSDNGVVVEAIEPPTEAFNGDARRWYSVYVSIDYVSYS